MSEVYSPPRVAAMAVSMGMKSGDSLDITTVNDKGEPWDFDRRTRETRPDVLSSKANHVC